MWDNGTLVGVDIFNYMTRFTTTHFFPLNFSLTFRPSRTCPLAYAPLGSDIITINTSER